ncbi:hypothetical protein [Nocardia flavorosea]|uniref:Lipoprotein LpqN n=1 Tax=Nocardia flavorosea TaxID=53429 RepID=A0A846YST6_9NOCA|nr:hypothetical protein [Nocardia flavorosea]NKY60544.1 hypothetical protein [Nocardia flavorosea]
MGVIRRRKTAGALAVLVTVLAGMTGCGSDSQDSGRPTEVHRQANTTDVVREASAFAGIVIPANVTVLDARTERGIDTLYQLAVSTDPQGLDELLAASHFSTPLTKAYSVPETTIAGPPLETSPAVLEASDTYRNAEGKTVNRSIIVDERAPSIRFVHLQLFDT